MIKTINGKRPSAVEKPFWIASFTGQEHSGRTTECKIFDKMKDAKEVFKDGSKYGFLTRAEGDIVRTFAGYFNGFEPSATQGIMMKQLFGYVPECSHKRGILI